MKKQSKEEKMKSMGSTPVFKLLMMQSLPNVVSLLSISLYQLVNSMFVGKYLNEAGLAAQSVFSPIEYLTCTSLPVAFSIGVVSLIGPALGRGDVKQACEYLMQYLYWSLVYVCAVPALLLPFMDQLLRGMGAATQEVLGYARQYAVVLISVGPLVYTPNGGFLPLLRVENRALTAMFVQISSSVLNLLFNFILFPTVGQKLHLFVPAMSTCFSLAMTGVFTICNYLGCFKRSILVFVPRIKPNLKIIKAIIIQAFPQFLNALPQQLGILIANVQIKKYSESPTQTKTLIACMQVYANLSNIMLQPRQAIYLGFISILSFQIGAKLHKRVLQLFKIGFWTSILLIGSLTAIMIGIADIAATWFNGTTEFQHKAAHTFRIASFGYPFGGPLMFCSGIFQMEHKPLIASAFQGIRLAIYITLLLLEPIWLPIEHIFYVFSISDTLTGIVGIVCYWLIYKKYAKSHQDSAQEPAIVPAKQNDAIKLETPTQPQTESQTIQNDAVINVDDKLHGDQ